MSDSVYRVTDRQLWRAVVGVDNPFDVAAELQSQPEVALHGMLGHAAILRRFRLPQSAEPAPPTVDVHVR